MTKIWVFIMSDYDGDQYLYYTTNKELYDWVLDDTTTLPNHLVDAIFNDPVAMKNAGNPTKKSIIEETTIDPQSGSFYDDKASIMSCFIYTVPVGLRKLDAWAKDNNFEIVDTLEATSL